MKKLLIQFLIFVIPFIAIPHFADIFISNNLKKSGSYAGGEYSTWNDIYDGKINSEIVIYGSSRGVTQINTSMISDSLHATTYSLGICGHSFLLEYFRHTLLLEYNRKPTLIIQSLDVETLNKGPDLYNPDQFLPYMLHNKEMKKVTLLYNGYSPIDYEIPLLRYYGKKEAFFHALKLFISPSNNEVLRTKGYQGRDIQWNDDLKKAKQEKGSYTAGLNASVVSLFERFLIECRQNDTKIIFVYTPEFIEGQEFVKNRDVIINLYNQISKKYDIPFLDYSKDTICLQKKYFSNSTHLNKFGAEQFTSKLIVDIRPYWKEIDNLSFTHR